MDVTLRALVSQRNFIKSQHNNYDSNVPVYSINFPLYYTILYFANIGNDPDNYW